MPQFNKRGNRIRASDKSLVFRFSAGSTRFCCPCYGYAAESKDNPNY